MAGADKLTDHEEIKKWAEKHDAKPMRVEGTDNGDSGGLIRISTGQDDDRLEEMSWDDWFKEFENSKLALLVEDTDKGVFHKLVSR